MSSGFEYSNLSFQRYLCAHVHDSLTLYQIMGGLKVVCSNSDGATLTMKVLKQGKYSLLY